jgi:hypothetical protein
VLKRRCSLKARPFRAFSDYSSFQALTIEELEILEATHINLREGKIRVVGTDRTNERVLKLEAIQVFELQEYLNKTRSRILYGPKVNEPERIEQLIIGRHGRRSGTVRRSSMDDEKVKTSEGQAGQPDTGECNCRVDMAV